jgi:hypothetical protein
MTTDPRIEAAARQVAVEHGYPDFLYPDGMAEVTAKAYRDQGARILAAADKAATITTHEQSGELPLGTVAISDDGDLWERLPSGWAGIIHESGSEPWIASGCEEPQLPARVIHWGQA